jgi:hypothetical protein
LLVRHAIDWRAKDHGLPQNYGYFMAFEKHQVITRKFSGRIFVRCLLNLRLVAGRTSIIAFN